MAQPYRKPHLRIGEQVDLLAARGMDVGDRDLAQRWLSVVGYYRLSGYWYPFRQWAGPGRGRSDRFAAGTSLARVVALYEMDRRLKLLVLDAAASRPPSGGPSRYRTWLGRVAEAQRRSTEDFVEHFRVRYDGRLPTWVVTEVLDFGGLSTLFSMLERVDRDAVASGLGVLDADGRGAGRAVENWLRVLTYLRNVCAHHSRLWNRNMTVQLSSAPLRVSAALAHLADGPVAARSRVYGSLCVLGYLLEQVAPDSSWPGRMSELLVDGMRDAGRSVGEMGFSTGWGRRSPFG